MSWQNTTGDSWGRIGRLQITTTAAFVVVTVVSMLVWIVVPTLGGALGLTVPALLSGQVWRVVTWPLVNGVSLFGLLNLFFFWIIGHDLEATLGRNGMAKLLAGVWASLTVACVLVGLVLQGTALVGASMILFAIFLLWIAENPRRPMFFNIPAWVLGALILGVNIAQMLAYRDGGGLLTLLLSLALVAVWARRLGLLTQYAWLPGGPRRQRRRAARTSATQPTASRRERKQAERRANDDERLDTLLAKISEQGLHSLTPAERSELDQIRLRRRG